MATMTRSKTGKTFFYPSGLINLTHAQQPEEHRGLAWQEDSRLPQLTHLSRRLGLTYNPN